MSSGHQRAADAVRESISLLSPSWETEGVDAFSYVYPHIGKMVSKSYLDVLRYTPKIWNYIYDNPDVVTATQEIREVLNLISWPKLKGLYKKQSPQAIVCTQAAPCSVFASEKRKGKVTVPLVAIVTDFAVHSYWVYDTVDLYCVASEDTRRELIRRGVSASKIAVTGIPISPAFLQKQTKEAARAKLELDPNKSTVLVMGGSQGMGPLLETLDQLHALPAQFIVSAGVNKNLLKQLQKRWGRDRRVKIFGYSDAINTFMDAADLLVTKPGGLTSSEAMAKGVPMIVTNPIPGQEERNARFLLKHGVAERADESTDIIEAVRSLIQHPLKLKRMAERTKEIARPYAGMEIARHLFRLVSS